MSIKNILAISALAKSLCEFLPGTPYPYADANISFPGCAYRLGIGHLWKGGSKLPALTHLLQSTLERTNERFCPLLLEIVKTGIPYRVRKNNPLYREEMEVINHLIAALGFVIPDFVDKEFLDAIPNAPSLLNTLPEFKKVHENRLKEKYRALADLKPHIRGYSFQNFLNDFFQANGLLSRGAFRLTGEEIDGSFALDGQPYLLEAKWRAQKCGQSELLHFNGKVEGKSVWARGIFISYTGFTEDGLIAFARGRRTSIIGINGLDLDFILDSKITLLEAIRRKLRRAAETNEFFVSIHELL